MVVVVATLSLSVIVVIVMLLAEDAEDGWKEGESGVFVDLTNLDLGRTGEALGGGT